MSSDNQYTALGPTIIGFQTNGTNIDRGAEIAGNEFGIRGSCFDGTAVIADSTNGPGVEAFGETGVIGHGRRGPGVEGIGGHGQSSGIPQAGVIGQGARRPDEDNPQGAFHGTGVIGIGGARGRLPHQEHVTGSVGVFGQGAEADVRTVDGTVHGPRSPGAGVVGRGGEFNPEDGPGDRTPAPGVVGMAGGTGDLIPGEETPTGQLGDVGVYGMGGTGVKGVGSKGPGVEGHGSYGEGIGGSRGVTGPGVVGRGGIDLFGARTPQHGAGVIGLSTDAPTPPFAETSDIGVYGKGKTGVKGSGNEGRGGVFQSERSAQVRLVPAKRPPRGKEQAAFTPTIVANPATKGPELPRGARGGDLMSIVDDQGQCSLWFCVRDGASAGTAQWAQVLLGPLFDGTT